MIRKAKSTDGVSIYLVSTFGGPCGGFNGDPQCFCLFCACIRVHVLSEVQVKARKICSFGHVYLEHSLYNVV